MRRAVDGVTAVDAEIQTGAGAATPTPVLTEGDGQPLSSQAVPTQQGVDTMANTDDQAARRAQQQQGEQADEAAAVRRAQEERQQAKAAGLAGGTQAAAPQQAGPGGDGRKEKTFEDEVREEEASRVPGALYQVSAEDAVRMRHAMAANAPAEREERRQEEERRADQRWEWEQQRQREAEEWRGEQDAARGAVQRAAEAAERAEAERRERQEAGEAQSEVAEVEPSSEASPSPYSRPVYEAAREGPGHLDQVAKEQAAYFGQTVTDHGRAQSALADEQERQEAQSARKPRTG